MGCKWHGRARSNETVSRCYSETVIDLGRLPLSKLESRLLGIDKVATDVNFVADGKVGT